MKHWTGDSWTTRAGQKVVIRPIRVDDEEGMARFHRSLSPATVYTRYFNTFKLSARIAHERLGRVCHPAPNDETVLVVVRVAPSHSDREIIGVARLSVMPSNDGEVAFVVADSYQGQGIGSELLRRLLQIARQRKLRSLGAHILPANLVMQRICARAGLKMTGGPNGAEVRADLEL